MENLAFLEFDCMRLSDYAIAGVRLTLKTALLSFFSRHEGEELMNKNR